MINLALITLATPPLTSIAFVDEGVTIKALRGLKPLHSSNLFCSSGFIVKYNPVLHLKIQHKELDNKNGVNNNLLGKTVFV